MNVHSILSSSYDSNIFIISGEKATIVDTGTGMNKNQVISQINSFLDIKMISQIILTHEHFDHAGGVKQIYEAAEKKPKIIAHKAAVSKIESGESIFARMLGGTMPKMPVDVKLSGGETLQIGDDECTVFSTPGHTPGCICLYEKNSKTLFSGDTIFANGSFGRTDFPGGSRNQLKQSIQHLSNLDVTNLYPGHEMIVEGNANKHIQMSLRNVNYF